MINNIMVTNYLEETIVLNLRNPEESGFQVLGIDGLGPSKANINTTDNPTNDGSSFNSAREEKRNIVLYLGYLENPTIQATRRLSYRYFPVKQKIWMKFDTEDRVDVITGYVESNEINIFGKDMEGSIISIICPNPYFYSQYIQTTIFSGITSVFQFPFSNESLTLPLINLGEVFTNKEQNIYYEGDEEIGMTIYIDAMGGTVIDPVIYNSRTGDLMRILSTPLAAIVSGGFINGDSIVIETRKGMKSVTHIRNGILTNVMNALDKNASWITLVFGDNLFRYTAASGEVYMQLKVDNQTFFTGI